MLCALVQFKTIGSRDPNHIERDHLYLGTTIYKFTSAANPIALIGLICSDAFEFTDRVNDHHDSLLLLHIQLNQKPSHAAYARYRQRMFDIASNSRVEFLCLNWAAGVTCDDKIWSDIAGSMWCISPLSQPPTDADVDSLHNQGIYYSLVSERWHGYYLNYRPHALLLRKSPVFVEGQQVLAQHTAPEVIERLGWDPDSETWVAEPADDGFTAFIGGYQALNGSLPALRDQSALAVERALELLAGPPGRPYSWHALSELESLRVGQQDSLRCVTVCQEEDPAREGVVFRRHRARLAQSAEVLPGSDLEWPPALADLAVGFEWSWDSMRPHANIVAATGAAQPATLLYLGENPEASTVENMYAKLKRALIKHEVDVRLERGDANLDSAPRAADRLCIVYRQNNALRIFRPADYADITRAGEVVPNDLTRSDG